MKIRISTLVAATLLSVVFALPLPLYAHDGDDHAENAVTVAESEDTNAEDKSELESRRERLKEGVKARLEKRKSEMQVKLSAAQQVRLKSRCVNAQGVIKTHDEKINTRVNKRNRAYDNISSRIEALLEKLETQEVDTLELASQLAVLREKLLAYETNSTAFQTALVDLHAMDCAADPEGFKASLDSARTLREELSTSVADIKMYIKESIKPTLVSIRQQLAGDMTTEEGEL